MISLIYPYYNNKEMLKVQTQQWKTFPNYVEIVLVDDGSEKEIDQSLLKGLNVRVFRIKEDIPWNVSGAKNLGVLFARFDKILISDIDRVFPPKIFSTLQHKDLTDTYYVFNQINYDGSERLGWHQGTVYLSKYNYWRVKGLDEDFSGYYGHEDGNLLKKLKRLRIKRELLPHHQIICYDCNPNIPDASSPLESYGDRTINGKLSKQKDRKIPVSLDILRFEWE